MKKKYIFWLQFSKMQKPKKSYILLDSGGCLIWDNAVPSAGSPLVLQSQEVDALEYREIFSANLCNYILSTMRLKEDIN